MFINFWLIYSVFSFVAFSAVCVIVASHIYARFKRPKPLKLSPESIVLIVGACTGIGKIMAIEIAKQFHSTILIVDRRKDLFEEVSSEIKKYNGICDCFMCDLSDLRAIDKLIASIKQQRPHIDLMIYNAGIVRPGDALQSPEEDLHAVMNVNFFAPAKLISGLQHSLKGGHVAVVASVVSIIDGGLELSSYVASKHAIFGYLNCMRQQLKKSGQKLSLSIGCPYAINTTMFQGFKTRYDKLLPVLDEKYVGERLVREFIDRKEVCFVGRRHALLVKLTKFLPTYLQDWALINMDMSNHRKNK